MIRPMASKYIKAYREDNHRRKSLFPALNKMRIEKEIEAKDVAEYLGLDLDDDEMNHFESGRWHLSFDYLRGYAAFIGVEIHYELRDKKS